VKIRCVIYDCDGVLFDSLDANRRLYNHICASGGRGELTDEELHFCHMHTVFESVHHLFPVDLEAEVRALEFLKAVNLGDYVEFLKMEPHLLETLAALRGRGIRTAISTNRTTSMPYVMKRFNLSPYFDMVVTALDVTRPKPHEESVEKILAELELGRDEVVYIGDSEIDKKTAAASGVTFIAYKNPAIADGGLSMDDHLAVLSLLSDERLLQS
jgi:HAD superfamily hydrolase (TIGR01549 family)